MKNSDHLKQFPADWDEPIRFRGYSRNTVNKSWMVRLGINGKQEFIGLANSQEQAARLYDLALWRLAPKLRQRIKPNFPDDFTFINHDKVTRTCPRLDKIFFSLPYVRTDDDRRDEDELRTALLAGSRSDCHSFCPAVANFEHNIIELKKLRTRLEGFAVNLELAELKTPLFHKLAVAPVLWGEVQASLRQTAGMIERLEASMEHQREYFVKMHREGRIE